VRTIVLTRGRDTPHTRPSVLITHRFCARREDFLRRFSRVIPTASDTPSAHCGDAAPHCDTPCAAVRHACAALRHACAAVRHACAAVRHACAAVRHACAAVRHACAAVRHACAALRHACAAVRHACAAVRHACAAVRHACAALRHACAALRHALRRTATRPAPYCGDAAPQGDTSPASLRRFNASVDTAINSAGACRTTT
jgi:hypothetical protein